MLNMIYNTGLRYVVFLAPFAFILVLSFGINRMRASTAQMVFWLFSGVMGLSLASVFLVYTGQSIVTTFFVSSSTFLAMALYGYTTKRDLTGWGSFLFMGLIGLIVASLVGLFVQSSALQFAISVIGVLIFTGLTAYDTQKIKEMYYAGDSSETGGKKAVMGALVALSRLHQPLPLPAALHRRPPLSNATHSERTGAIWPRFCFARALARRPGLG